VLLADSPTLAEAPRGPHHQDPRLHRASLPISLFRTARAPEMEQEESGIDTEPDVDALEGVAFMCHSHGEIPILVNYT
jgi:hypothetical protein